MDVRRPPGAVTAVQIEQVERLPPIFGRADLAIAAREVAVDGNTVTGTVHNIGSADAPDVVVAVLDASGNPVARTSVGALAAPLDLMQRRAAFALTLPGKPGPGWRLMLDPERRIPEIYEGNNEVALDGLPAADYSKGWE